MVAETGAGLQECMAVCLKAGAPGCTHQYKNLTLQSCAGCTLAWYLSPLPCLCCGWVRWLGAVAVLRLCLGRGPCARPGVRWPERPPPGLHEGLLSPAAAPEGSESAAVFKPHPRPPLSLFLSVSLCVIFSVCLTLSPAPCVYISLYIY